MTDKEKEVKAIDEVIRGCVKSSFVKTVRYAKFGGFDGYNEICTADIAEALYNAGYKQEKEVVKEILQPIYELCKVRKEITFDDLNFLVIKYGIELE